ADPSVAGAQVTITINQTGATFTTFTNSSGGFSFSFPVNYAPGTYTVTVVITDFTLSSTTLLTFTVVVPQCLPDLTLSTFVSSTNIVQGESITGSYFIKNVGCEDVTDSTLLGKSQSGGTPIMANEKIGPLAVNQSVTIPFGPLAFNTPGTFSICGTADAGFQVQESSESNNSQCQVITVIPFLPDIFPTFCGGGTRYISDDVINLGFGLQNSGGSATGQFLAKVLIFKDGIKVDSFDHVVPNVARQSGYSFSIPYSFNQVGTYSIQIQCDAPVPGGVVAETDETNNVATCSMVVLPTFADLTIGGCGQVKVLPANPVFPGTVQYQATIRNNGNATATGPIPVQFRVGNSAPVIVNIPGNLAPGQSVVVNSGNQASVAPATAGLSVTVNPLQTINESDFGNNKDSSQLCHDFQPIDIPPLCGSNFWNSTYLTNQAIFLWVGVNQYYYYDASQVKVRFFVSGPGLNGTINLGDALLNNVSRNCGCPYLATLPTNFAFPQEGVYTFTMTVDPDGDFTECDETNNTIVRQVRVSGLPDMRILSQMINPSLLNPQPDVPINISVSYENIGASNIDQQMMLKVLVDEVPLDSAIVNGLVTGDNGTVDFTTPWSSSTVGAHVIRTIIDSRNQVEENDEINNEATRAVIVGDAANLYFQVFAPNNGSPAFGQNITINARIGNNGDEATNATVVFYFINNQGDTIQIGQRSISVNGNDSLNISIPWTVINPTTTLIGKIINSEISEFNYDDNVATAPIGLFGVTLTPTPACAGQPKGQLAVSTTGGTEPFTYQWSNGFTGQILTAGPGLYTVTVTDFLGVLVQAQGVIPNQPGQVYYADSDGDGYGNPAISQTACVLPPGFVANNLDCNDTDPTVYKKVSRPSILRIGGPDFCAGSSVQLSVPELNGVLYQWSSGQQTASISVTAEGTYFVTLAGDSVCPVNSDTVQLNILNSIVPQVSISGSNGTVCEGSTVSLQASIVNGGQNPSVSWLVNGVISGSGNVFSPQNLTNGDLVKVVLSASESCANPASVSDSLTFNVLSQPFANAGFGQSICGNSTQLTANTVSGAIGKWTVEAGTGVFVDQNDPLTVVSGLSNGINRFRWTLTNGVCPPDFDQVIITVSPQGVVANAGQDQSICQSAFATLSGNSPGNGTGLWTVIQGTGQVNNPIQPNSLVSNLSFGQNVLVWTVTSGTCEPLTDTVVISRFETPVLASAGLDQSICGSRTQLSAEVPVIGQGQWSVAGGTAIFDNPSNPQSGVSGLSIGDNVLVWTITNGNCASQTDEVVINVTPGGPSQAIAGPDQIICGDTTLLAAGIPQTGIGVWKVVSGNAQIIDSTNAQSKVDLPATGQSVLVWTVSEGSCAPSTDTVIISRIDAEIANAGPDQFTCSTSANLQAHQPFFGSGSWSVTLGTATVDNPNDPFSAVSGLESGENKFVWTIVNGDCPPSSDTVIITSGNGNLTANAGFDQEICADTAQLSANFPDPNSGTWSVAVGSGIFDDETQPGTTIRGLEVGITKLVWTITDPVCGSVTDTVTITRIAAPSQANAGSDQNVCDDQITLSANAPQVGIGSWEWVEDEGTITDIHNPFTQVTGLVSGTNTFVWTISNGNCPASKDTVVITREEAPTIADAGSDETVCTDQTSLDANVPQTGTGAWTVISGSAVISDSTSATSSVTNLSVGINEFVWSVTNGSCPASTDTVVITRVAAPSTANA
ncbi:MAG TPA: CARDB domain-containing protein, partial [Catalimonadaceae bacterium]|nr:CARDB domain-containing protein [Catalimonadaceae bacterium]